VYLFWVRHADVGGQILAGREYHPAPEMAEFSPRNIDRVNKTKRSATPL
jgi:hypothetical protein